MSDMINQGIQMAEAAQRQMERRRASYSIDRKGWTRQQWIEDADRLMNEVDGAITSLVNGHIMHLLDHWRATSNQTVRWCKVHNSVADSLAEHCHWDKWAGSRPGRGECSIEPMGLFPMEETK